MSSYPTTRWILVCDGCEEEHGAPTGHLTALEMRAAAYADGWRFPARVKANGDPSKQTNDVCPKCIDGWTPNAASDGGWTSRRAR